MNEWKPIESAPRSARSILAFGRLGFGDDVGYADRWYGAVYWSCGDWAVDCRGSDNEVIRPPIILTHWMPLPEPPITHPTP